MSQVYLFNRDSYIEEGNLKDTIGIRGVDAMGLAALSLPLAPGFVFDHNAVLDMSEDTLVRGIKKGIASIENKTKKVFGGSKFPLTVKVVVSPSIQIESIKSIHNVGLNNKTTESFAQLCGEDFAYGEYKHLIEEMATRFLDVQGVTFQLTEKALSSFEERKVPEVVRTALKDFTQQEAISEKEFLENLTSTIGENAVVLYQTQILRHAYNNIFQKIAQQFEGKSNREICAYYLDNLVPDFPQDPHMQLAVIVAEMRNQYLDDPHNEGISAGVLIQMMTYGNLGDDSYNGSYFSRNIVTGNDLLSGYFGENQFWTHKEEATDINLIDPKYLKQFQEIATILEEKFLEIREVKFAIERGVVWVVEQKAVPQKSTRAELKTYLDLNKRKIIKDEDIVNNIPPKQLNDLLHPIVDKESSSVNQQIKGGIAGSPGAAVGRVYFTTERFLDAYRDAQIAGKDTNLIIAMEATYAGDVQAIEIGQGVISSEGGYSSHAPVVARSLGKAAMINPNIEFGKDYMIIEGVRVEEGDYITMEVPTYEDPIIYLGKVDLVYPNIEENGLQDFMEIAKKFTANFHIRTNVDSPNDAKVAKKLGATGIGLCRTEHMFFQPERINIFRELLIASTLEERLLVLEKLKPMQQTDFEGLFEVMEGESVTIRLLDAPLHEFLPQPDQLDKTLEYFEAQGLALSKDEMTARLERLKETNPMLGHRGCRVAISYPEIYEMQVTAVLEAAYNTIVNKKINVYPEIMIPIVMNDDEVKFIKNGRDIEGMRIKGIRGVVQDLCDKYGVKKLPFEYKVGAMIELPAAALSAGHISKQAEFFSFGTNDLTQTTCGISRDDINSFLPAYTKFDIFRNNPFEVLTTPVKELIAMATQTGRIVRPDLKVGLCGEHGAVPENISFCIDTGLDYVSCSPYGVPIATLAVAQYNLSKKNRK
ncbi:MAG: pyruvate,orthophosphate dikinase [bacterium]|jgi:pyruvate,orthophosphate dikinase